MKTCSKCGVEKEMAEFSARSNRPSGRRSECKRCCSKAHTAYYYSAPEKARARSSTWAKENPDRVVTKSSAYYKNNKSTLRAKCDKWKAENPEKTSASMSMWKKSNRCRCAAIQGARRAGQLQATPVWASKEKIEEFYYTADMLGMHTGGPYHVDHVVPLKNPLVCGLHCEFNLQVLTGPDNLRKSNKFEVSP